MTFREAIQLLGISENASYEEARKSCLEQIKKANTKLEKQKLIVALEVFNRHKSPQFKLENPDSKGYLVPVSNENKKGIAKYTPKFYRNNRFCEAATEYGFSKAQTKDFAHKLLNDSMQTISVRSSIVLVIVMILGYFFTGLRVGSYEDEHALRAFIPRIPTYYREYDEIDKLWLPYWERCLDENTYRRYFLLEGPNNAIHYPVFYDTPPFPVNGLTTNYGVAKSWGQYWEHRNSAYNRRKHLDPNHHPLEYDKSRLTTCIIAFDIVGKQYGAKEEYKNERIKSWALISILAFVIIALIATALCSRMQREYAEFVKELDSADA